ncbi:MAG: peptidoglycan DD-metalloendopeptidase family protein, partial [Proteobacteria bacterium]|nr:peptidoglycan DD-metalloendopeptidase family protein [Pseudomonadota bacterium]
MLSFLKTDFKIAVLIVGVFLFSNSMVAAAEDLVCKGVVTSFKLNIRQRPSQEADVVIVAQQDEILDVVSEPRDPGQWLKVRYKGQEGYVRNRSHYIRLKPAVSEAQKQAMEAEKKEKEKLEARIQTQEKIVETFSQKEIEMIDGLNETDYTLNKARLKLSALTLEREQLEARISSLNSDWDQLSREISQNREYAGKRLRALYKMNMIGRLDAAGLPSSVFDFFLQQNSMKRVIKSDFQLLEKQDRDLKRFKILEKELQQEMAAKTELEVQVRDQVRISQKETQKKEMILMQIRKQKRLSLAAVEALKDAAIQLDNRMNNLQEEDSTASDEFSFSNYKGRLLLPVKGEVISEYGPSTTGDSKAFTFQKGIDIRVERGEPVKSVFKGEVIFAQWLKGYGNLLIINHGDNYYTLYAHIEEFFKKKGERVETGEVVATAGDTGSIKGMCLHFEVRYHG